MRTAFITELTKLAAGDPRITFITGDLGYSVIEEFAERLPDQFLNVGVAEQNMTGIAAGMALCGRIVFTYSIANFPTIRCLEQVRNDICYHNANVKIVAVGGGLAYGSLGYTHHAVEDLAIMRSMPGMGVVAPGDPVEAAAATRAVAETPGPWYLRLGKTGERVCHDPDVSFKLGKAIVARGGGDATLVATGGMLQTALDVADRLERSGIHLRVLSMHTLHPLDADAVICAAAQTRALVTLEEHNLTGGLGAAVGQVLAARGAAPPLCVIALPRECTPTGGGQEDMRRRYGLDVESVSVKVASFLDSVRSGAAYGTSRTGTV